MKTSTTLAVLVAALSGTILSHAQTDGEIIRQLAGKWLHEDDVTVSSWTFKDKDFEMVTHEKQGDKGEVMTLRGSIEISQHQGLRFLNQQFTELWVRGSKVPLEDEKTITEMFIIKKGKLFIASAFDGNEQLPPPSVTVWERPVEDGAQVRFEQNPPEKEDFHLFLLVGQSNMAGRGIVSEADRKIHPRVWALSKDGAWAPAVDPIHWDKPSAGVGLGKSFGITLATQNKDVVIGLIPAACGGTGISAWEPGSYYYGTQSHPYDDAIQRAKRAMKDGTLKGILWAQGEGDCSAELAPQYRERLVTLIERFRKDLNAESVPFLIGQMAQSPEMPWDDSKKIVHDAHISVAHEDRRVGFVPSDGLTFKSDNVHFDTDSLRTFGKRYAEVYMELVQPR